MVARMLQPKSTYTFEYPEAAHFADEQNKVFWLWDEIDLEKDVQDVLVNLTAAEKHGLLTVLKLFVKYEVVVGNEYWGGRFKRTFKHPDLGIMADSFAFFETNVHARFYNQINKLLHLDTDEFFNSYAEDEVLNERIKFIEEIVCDPDPLVSLAAFAMVEGSILFSSFAFIKHFQSNGKNLVPNFVAGVNFSVRDENIHNAGGSWAFRKLLSESNLTPEALMALYDRLYSIAEIIRQHEHRIVDMIFEKGTIKGITAHQMKVFIDSRIDYCLELLGLSKLYNVANNPIAEWFYNGIKSYVFHDFFTKVGREYNRKWNESAFEWDDDYE